MAALGILHRHIHVYMYMHSSKNEYVICMRGSCTTYDMAISNLNLRQRYLVQFITVMKKLMYTHVYTFCSEGWRGEGVKWGGDVRPEDGEGGQKVGTKVSSDGQ